MIKASHNYPIVNIIIKILDSALVIAMISIFNPKIYNKIKYHINYFIILIFKY
jgi:hypothetical protein